MHRLLVVLATCSLTLPAVALADAVPAPPADCPDGSHGRTGHAGPWCNPTTCTTDADCREEGTACREAALCVEREQYRQGGWAGDEQATREIAHGPCGADGQCTEGDCRRAKYCLRTGGDTSAGSDTAPPEEQPPAEQPPTTMDTPDEQAPGGAAKQPPEQQDDAEREEQRAQQEEDDDDGGCSSTGARRAPVGVLAPLVLAAMARRRRNR